MIRLPNYELALSHLASADGAVVPIIALSFADEDLPGCLDLPWTDSNCRLTITDQGLAVSLAGHEVVFPLVSSPSGVDPEHPTAQGLDRKQVLALLSAHQHLFVCAFNQEGDLVASIGFATQPSA